MEFEGRSRIHTELNIAPLIDVVFLLLVFFMLTSTLITQEGIEVALPGSSQANEIEQSPIVISLTKDGGLFLNSETIDETTLSVRLQALLANDSTSPIVLKSDAELDVQRLISTMDLIRQAGGTNISLATKKQ
ncbi:MAG: biopolymer transporter ExbD [Bdellovibrionales bacterium]|nr:biopolymer transporter ExbD [Bdellovibrionales bacterium]